ncbi:MAG: FG-GAP-like repeat-containing protein [Paludibacter sp.]|nr:FG-GAP-like repeat-containing protein [Paludibacter sp.]
MKTNYFFKHALIFGALFCLNGIFAQTAKTPNFVEVVKPVINGVDLLGAPIKEDFAFTFENAVSWGDYNNDGFLDVITVGVGNSWAKQTFLYKNNGDGTFTKVVTPFPNLEAGNATWFDYNNDGNLDLLLCGNDDIGPYTALYKNLGSGHNYDFEQVFDGSFEYVNNGGGNRANRYAIAGDIDNDGWADIYLQGQNASGRLSILYKNLKGKGFQKIDNPVNGTDPFIQLNAGSASFGDYDGDGYLDLLVNGYAAASATRTEGYVGALYKNNGNGTFAAPVTFDGTESGESAFCDYNNDGKLDYIVTGVGLNSGGWYWKSDLYENNGNGTFTLIPAAQNGMPNNKQETSIAWGDVNNDGYSDLLYMNADPNTIFLNNFGDQTFKRSDLVYTTPTGGTTAADFTYTGNQWGGSASLVDFDRDGNLDAITAAYGFAPRLMKNQLGTGILSNTAPTAPTNLKATIGSNGVVTFTWNASTDDTTLAEGLKYNLYVKQNGNDSVKIILPADLTTGRLKVNETLAPLVTTSYKISNLGGGSYTFGVQAIDNSKVASHFATAPFTVAPNALPTVDLNNIKVLTKGNVIQVNANEDVVGSVNVYDLRGLNIRKLTGKVNGSKVEVSAGIYIVKVTSGASTFVKKVVLN